MGEEENGARNIPSIDVVKEEMIEQRRIQSSSIDSLDTKIGVLIGFVLTSSILYFANIRLRSCWEFVLTLLVVIGLAFSFGGFLCAFWPRKFRFNPKPKVLLENYMFRDPTKKINEKYGSKEQILADQVDAYEKNSRVLRNKSFCLKFGLIALAVAYLLILVSLILFAKEVITK